MTRQIRYLPLYVADPDPDAPGTDDWQERGLCAQVGGNVWYPEQGESVREAKDICANCEVRDACLEDALARDERWGVWGGMTLRERMRIQRDRDAAAVDAMVSAA